MSLDDVPVAVGGICSFLDAVLEDVGREGLRVPVYVHADDAVVLPAVEVQFRREGGRGDGALVFRNWFTA